MSPVSCLVSVFDRRDTTRGPSTRVQRERKREREREKKINVKRRERERREEREGARVKEILEVIQDVFQERISERIAKQISRRSSSFHKLSKSLMLQAVRDVWIAWSGEWHFEGHLVSLLQLFCCSSHDRGLSSQFSHIRQTRCS